MLRQRPGDLATVSAVDGLFFQLEPCWSHMAITISRRLRLFGWRAAAIARPV